MVSGSERLSGKARANDAGRPYRQRPAGIQAGPVTAGRVKAALRHNLTATIDPESLCISADPAP